MLRDVRTTVRLDESLLKEAREYASRTDRTLSGLIEDALRSFMRSGRRRLAAKPSVLKTFRGRGLQPGINLDNTAALLDLLDRGDAAR